MHTDGFDLVIRNGLVVDGIGSEPRQADVAVKDGMIARVGTVVEKGATEIDASGNIVTPGFVDVHTHFDGQATWTNRLAPSSNHGVTTVITGNCGVGFAPSRPADRDNMIRLMEGVEDIPGVVMSEGLPWTWETFPEYMEFLGGRAYDVDIAAMLPHAPLRVYAMGQRGLQREPATTADMARMRELTAEAIRAGAIGVGTSRSLNHRSSDLQLLPNVSAAEGELVALAEGIKDGGGGVLQAITDFDEPETDFSLLRRVVERTGVRMSFSLMQFPHCPDRWRQVLALTEQANDNGLTMKAQVFVRPVGANIGLNLSFNFFSFSPSYIEIADLPLAERIERMRDPELRRRIIAEYPTPSLEAIAGALANLDNIFLMDEIPDYEPALSDSIGARARALGVAPAEHAYDLLIANEGRNIFYIPAANFVGGTTEAVSAMLNHPHTLIGLGDGGAHVGIICDASWPTYSLRRWVGKDGDADGGEGAMSLARMVEKMTSANARAVNLHDRGVVAEGYRADLNIIDLDALKLYRPEMVYDLPDGGGRLHQRSAGYVATIVHGEVTYRNGEPTGRLPGRLVRGAQQANTSFAEAAE